MTSPTSQSQAALVSAARDGDPSAWRALVDRHDRLILAVCRAHRLSRHDAEDVRQTTWLRAVEHLVHVQDPERVGAWLATVARRECLRVLNQAARARPCGDDELLQRQPADSPSPDEHALASERRAAVRASVTCLADRDRSLLAQLYAVAEPSYAEIGRRLEMPVGSIGPTRARVLERLRRHEPLATLAAAA
jgi:RNA polymerase sigma factor (sigma-70 family)